MSIGEEGRGKHAARLQGWKQSKGGARRRHLLISAGAVPFILTCALASHAVADDAHKQTDEATGATSVNEVVVTAQRQAQRLQDVPEAVTVDTQRDLAVRNITTIADLS